MTLAQHQPAVRGSYMDLFSGGGLPDQMPSDMIGYTRHLCRYLNNPVTIRNSVWDHCGRAPSLEQIKDILAQRRATVEAQRAKIRKEFEAVEREERKKENARLQIERLKVQQEEENHEAIEVAQEHIRLQQPSMFDIKGVLQAAANATGISYGELIGTDRGRKYLRGRFLAATLLRARGNSYPRIGQLLGGRDHSTAMNAIRSFFNREIRDPDMVAAWEALAPDEFKHVRTLTEFNALVTSL